MMAERQQIHALSVVPDRPRLPSLAKHLEPERLVRDHGTAIQAAVLSRFSDDWFITGNKRAAIEANLAKVPALAVLAQVAEDLTEALEAKPSRSVSAASVAVLYDSRARQAASPAMYVEALIYDLVDEGFPPCVVVAACQRLRREAVFTPEIAEVLKACRDVLAQYRAVARLASRLTDDRLDLEERLFAARRQDELHSEESP